MVGQKGGAGKARGARSDDGLDEALAALYAGLETIDRDLEVSEGRRADRVGVEADGRLLLVFLTSGEGDEPILCALDGLAFLARNREVLAEHFASERLDIGLEPRVILIAERFSDHLLERMRGLSREAVCTYERRTVASRRGQRTYLVPAEAAFAAAVPSDPDGRRSLLRALSPENVTLAEDLLRRVDRVDDELARAGEGGAVGWSFDGEDLCALRASAGGLEGRVGPAGTFVTLAGPPDAESYLEDLMRHFHGRLGGGAPDDEPVGSVSLLDPNAPILTAEEIAAFQEP